MKKVRHLLFCLLICANATVSSGQAKQDNYQPVKLTGFFSGNMVLQRAKPIKFCAKPLVCSYPFIELSNKQPKKNFTTKINYAR
jgi:hypothetical protein